MEDRILRGINKAVGEAIQEELVGYGKPLSKLAERVIAAHSDELYELMNDEFVELLTAESFRAVLKKALNEKLAKVLVSRMGGELEKQVNELKGNPVTRAKITTAINKVIEEMSEGEGGLAPSSSSTPDDEIPF